MGYLSEREYEARMKKILQKNASKERKLKLKEEKNKYKKKFKLPSTSKIVLFVVFIMCIEILMFSQYAMIRLGDASAMYTLIGVPATLVPTVIMYYWKSKNENTSGGITFETVMQSKEDDEICYTPSDDAQG